MAIQQDTAVQKGDVTGLGNLKNGCPVCRNLNDLAATQCRYCGTALTPPQPPVAAVPKQRSRWPLVTGAVALVVLLGVGGMIAFSGNKTAAPQAAATAIEAATDAGTALKFDPPSIDAPANKAIQINFTNKAQGIPHNMTFQAPISAKTPDQVEPGKTVPLEFTTPGPGQYKYVCTLHPGMEGTLNVK